MKRKKQNSQENTGKSAKPEIPALPSHSLKPKLPWWTFNMNPWVERVRSGVAVTAAAIGTKWIIMDYLSEAVGLKAQTQYWCQSYAQSCLTALVGTPSAQFYLVGFGVSLMALNGALNAFQGIYPNVAYTLKERYDFVKNVELYRYELAKKDYHGNKDKLRDLNNLIFSLPDFEFEANNKDVKNQNIPVNQVQMLFYANHKLRKPKKQGRELHLENAKQKAPKYNNGLEPFRHSLSKPEQENIEYYRRVLR